VERALVALGFNPEEEQGEEEEESGTDTESAERSSVDTREEQARRIVTARWPGDAELAGQKREAARLICADDKRKRRETLKGLKTAAMIRSFRPTTKWRKTVMRSQNGGDAMGTFLATMVGANRGCPMTRNGGAERKCACGYKATDDGEELDIHFHLNEGRSECKLEGFSETRALWRRRARAALGKEFGWTENATRQGSRGRLALLMGSPRPLKDLGAQWKGAASMTNRRSYLPVRTQIALMRAYVGTIGVWARTQWGEDEDTD
jgi:hypothetical protein